MFMSEIEYIFTMTDLIAYLFALKDLENKLSK